MSKALEDRLVQAAINEEIHIRPYDARWPEIFRKEKARLLNIFSRDLLEIEHIGSTAVPGLDAKPIIDMMAAVKSIEMAEKLLSPLRGFGYITPPECNDNLPERRWLMRQQSGSRTHHLHLVRLSSEGWKRTIQFRDILRSSASIAKDYRDLKVHLSHSCGSDRVKYIKGKTEFIENLLKSSTSIRR